MSNVLNATQALNALGLTVDVRQSDPNKGVTASAYRDGKVVAVTLRNTEGEAVEALYQNVADYPARRTSRKG